jgi:hypothetical protein
MVLSSIDNSGTSGPVCLHTRGPVNIEQPVKTEQITGSAIIFMRFTNLRFLQNRSIRFILTN